MCKRTRPMKGTFLSPFVILIWLQVPHNNIKSFMSLAPVRCCLSVFSFFFFGRPTLFCGFRPEFLCFGQRNHFLWVFITLKVKRGAVVRAPEERRGKHYLTLCNLRLAAYLAVFIFVCCWRKHFCRHCWILWNSASPKFSLDAAASKAAKNALNSAAKKLFLGSQWNFSIRQQKFSLPPKIKKESNHSTGITN